MNRKKRYKRILSWILCFTLIFTVFYSYYYVQMMIPEKIRIVAKQSGSINFRLPIGGTLYSSDKQVVLSNQQKMPTDKINITLDEPFSISSQNTGIYELGVKLFGFWSLRDISVEVVDSSYIIPCGIPVGIYLKSDGVMVIGTTSVTDIDGVDWEPAKDIVKSGDYIVAFNGETVNSKEDLLSAIESNGNNDIILSIRRDSDVFDVRVIPVNTGNNEYKLGIWVRDDTQGIGTLTYIDKDGGFGALGHGISDTDIGEVVQVSEGTLYQSDIHSIVKGSFGNPGSLSGIIKYGEKYIYGEIYKNSSQGIFGVANEKLLSEIESQPIAIGYKQDIKKDTAYIRCSVNGECKNYEIKILDVNTANNNHNKGIILQVTDEELLELTGGIVQGMSGSPIIQDDKLIGAVTHVFIQDSTKGYGIFIEDMISTQKQK